MGRSFVTALLLATAVAACASDFTDEPSGADDTIAAPGAQVPSRGAPASAPAQKVQPKSGKTTSPDRSGPLFRASADGTPTLNTFYRDETALQSDGTLTLATNKGRPGVDPQPQGYHDGSFYNGGTFRYGTVVSPVWNAAAAFDRVTPSFEAATPKGTWIEVLVTAHVIATNEWTKDFSLGVWAEDEGTVRRHSVEGQKDAAGDVLTDTLELTSPADALQVSIVMFSEDAESTPVVRAVSAVATSREAPSRMFGGDPTVWGKTLDVPKRAGGDQPASAAAMSMLLGFHGVTASPADAAALSSDLVANANHVFSPGAAPVASAGALHAITTRLWSFAQIEPLLASGIPVAIAVTYDAGELFGAALPSATEHTLVVKGFSATGDVVVHDPAFATDDAVETTLDRDELAAAWQRTSGATYVVWPTGSTLPADPLGAY